MKKACSSCATTAGADLREGGEATLPVIEEELAVGKREVERPWGKSTWYNLFDFKLSVSHPNQEAGRRTLFNLLVPIELEPIVPRLDGSLRRLLDHPPQDIDIGFWRWRAGDQELVRHHHRRATRHYCRRLPCSIRP